MTQQVHGPKYAFWELMDPSDISLQVDGSPVYFTLHLTSYFSFIPTTNLWGPLFLFFSSFFEPHLQSSTPPIPWHRQPLLIPTSLSLPNTGSRSSSLRQRSPSATHPCANSRGGAEAAHAQCPGSGVTTGRSPPLLSGGPLQHRHTYSPRWQLLTAPDDSLFSSTTTLSSSRSPIWLLALGIRDPATAIDPG
jgi:hypothetical protein